MAQCVACAALTLVVWRKNVNLSLTKLCGSENGNQTPHEGDDLHGGCELYQRGFLQVGSIALPFWGDVSTKPTIVVNSEGEKGSNESLCSRNQLSEAPP